MINPCIYNDKKMAALDTMVKDDVRVTEAQIVPNWKFHQVLLQTAVKLLPANLTKMSNYKCTITLFIYCCSQAGQSP